MQAGNWIALVGMLVSGIVAVVSLYLSDKRHREQLVREDDIRARHREDIPQIEFNLDCRQVGFFRDQHVIEFLFHLDNRGNVKQDIRSINLRVRAINAEDELAFWGNTARLEFPRKLIDTEVIPGRYAFIFIEPNVKQVVSFSTKLAKEVRFIAVRAEFSYGKTREGSPGNKHSVEHIYELDPAV